jgi:uncharacterized protein (DUF1697 family)
MSETRIALLRGVNVGGITIKMAELAEVFRGLGYRNVKTVLASGNVRFEAGQTASALKPQIEAALRERFGYQAWVHVITADELSRIVTAYPFEARDGWHRYVIFLMRDGVADAIADRELDASLERMVAGDGVLYWTVERGRTLDSVVGKATGAAKLKDATTTRNLNTLEKLLR